MAVDYGIPFNEHYWDWVRYHWFNPWWKPGAYKRFNHYPWKLPEDIRK